MDGAGTNLDYACGGTPQRNENMINFNNIELAVTAGREDQFPHDRLPQIALSGRSNVGKSSLLNTLVGRKALARVSSSPGKTITINFYRVDNSFYLVDLPGYGYAKRSPAEKERFARLTDAYVTSDRMCAAAQLIDLKTGPTADDLMMLDFLAAKNIPRVIIATKADKPNKTDRQRVINELSADRLTAGIDIIPFSALTGEGRDECRAALAALIS